MMHVLVGGSSEARSKKRRALLARTSPEELVWERMDTEEIATRASTGSLLGDTQGYVLVGALQGEKGEEFLSLAKGLVASPHVFVFEEEKLLKKPTDILTKAGVQIDMLPAVKKEEPFNVFGLANVFAMKDKKQLWLQLQESERRGVAPEAIAGMLHWKVRDMLGKGMLGKFSEKELTSHSRKLVRLYHDSHRGGGELSLLLERWALKL